MPQREKNRSMRPWLEEFGKLQISGNGATIQRMTVCRCKISLKFKSLFYFACLDDQ